jgi:hypothetical protein
MWKCHSEYCHFTSISQTLAYALSIAIIWFSVLSSLWQNCFRTICLVMCPLLHLSYFADDAAPTWQQSCTILSPFGIQSITIPQIFVCSANSFKVLCLSYPQTVPLCYWINRHRMTTMNVKSWPSSTYEYMFLPWNCSIWASTITQCFM